MSEADDGTVGVDVAGNVVSDCVGMVVVFSDHITGLFAVSPAFPILLLLMNQPVIVSHLGGNGVSLCSHISVWLSWFRSDPLGFLGSSLFGMICDCT